jgi:hypothetical protein
MSNRKHFGYNEHGVLSWIAGAPDVRAHDTGTPAYAISGFRWYGDSSTVDNGTAIAAEDAAITVGVGTGIDAGWDTFIALRIQYDETNGGDPGSYNHQLVYRINGAGTPQTPSTGVASPVEPATATWTHGDTTSQLLANAPSGSFTAGEGWEAGNTYLTTVNFSQDDYTEYHAALLVSQDGKTGAGILSDGDTIEFGILNEGTGTYVWSGTAINISIDLNQTGTAGLASAAFAALGATGSGGAVNQSGDAGLASAAFAALGATGTPGAVTGTAGLASSAFAALTATGTPGAVTTTAGLSSAAFAALGATGSSGAATGTAGLATAALAALGATGSQLSPIRLRDSSFIANGDPTTKQLSTPSGKVAGDFESGDIIEATSTALHNIGDRKFTEVEASLQVTSAAPIGWQYLVRHRRTTVGNILLDPGCELPATAGWNDVGKKPWFEGADPGTYQSYSHDTTEKYQGTASHKITVVAGGSSSGLLHHYAIWKQSSPDTVAPNGEYHGGAWIKATAGETVAVRVIRRVDGIDQYSGGASADVNTSKIATGSWEWVPVYLDTWTGGGTTDGIQTRVGFDDGITNVGATINIDGVIVGRTSGGWVDIPTGPTAWLTVSAGLQTGTAGLATATFAALGASGTPGTVTGTAGLSTAAFAALTASGTPGTVTATSGLATATFAALGAAGASVITGTTGLASAAFAALGVSATPGPVTGTAGLSSAAFAALGASGVPGAVTASAGLSAASFAALGASATPGTVTGTAGLASAVFAALGATGSKTTPTCTQERFQWRLDDGNEAAASDAAAEDANFSAAAPNTTYRLRVQVDADEGDPEAAQFRLEYRRKGTGNPWEIVE